MSGAVTKYLNPGERPDMPWSYSKLKNFETCPKRHWHYDIFKDVKEPESQQLKDGFFVHDVLAKRIEKGEPLPAQVSEHEHWVKRIMGGPPGKILVEQKLAIRKDFSKCNWFGDKSVWYRGIGDVIKIVGPVGIIWDWKTGKIVEDSVQLMLMAQCVFSHYPEVQAVRSEFIWLAHGATTREDFKRAEMAGHWAGLLPRVELMQHANRTQTYPAKTGGLCKRWCAVTSCPYNGE